MEKVTHVANFLKDINAKSASNDNDEPLDHQTRSNVIDILIRSHEYAIKAKQSSSSANKWLKSINSSVDECMNRDDDLISRLHSAESNISSKQEEISRLKMEIGRLESAARTKVSSNADSYVLICLNRAISNLYSILSLCSRSKIQYLQVSQQYFPTPRRCQWTTLWCCAHLDNM